MLKITIQAKECFDESKNEFIKVSQDTTIVLEHSLVSISKWESKWHKPFLLDDKKTKEELIDYIRCMTLTQNVDDNIYYCLTNDNIKKVNDYIQDPMTATTFYDLSKPGGVPKKEILTSEVIYYWMFSCQIPIECQKWHLNRLLTLIKVFGIKNNTNNKMGKKDVLANNRALNAARRQRMGSKG